MEQLQSKRRRLLAAALKLAGTQGFGAVLFETAERDARLAAGEASLLFPDGAGELISFWRAEKDAQILRRAAQFAALARTAARIEEAVFQRLQADQAQRPAARAAAAWLALPPHWPFAARQLYATSDTIWRAVRDKSVDSSFYSKRLILGGVYAAAHLFWLEDDSRNQTATRAFLKRRLQEVALFGKAKARWAETAEKRMRLLQSIGARRYDGGRKAAKRA